MKSPTAATSIRVAGVDHHFGEGETRKQILFGVELELGAGEIVIMTGPSGSGKTTLLTLIGGLRGLQAGEITILDARLAGLPRDELVDVRRRIGFIFQAHNLFDALTAFQNVCLALELHGVSRDEMKRRAEEILTRLGLGQRLHHKPNQLSGGQRQRVAIARALVARPRVILADEPTAALDKNTGREVVTILQERAREGATILIVTHDNRILDVADRIVNMVDGRVVSNVLVAETLAICEFLKGCDLFAALSPAALMRVAEETKRERVASGTTIIRQGEAGEQFFLIRDGQVDVFVAKAGEAAHKVTSLGRGEFFGEAALLSDSPRTATVTATSDVTLLVLGKAEFKAAVEGSPALRDQLRSVAFARQS